MTGTNRYVRTADIRAAIKGREADLLNALNIPWRDGKPHIRCPYISHFDNNPSWRWDERKARAYCTCHAGGHSALDVLMYIEGINFEAAKLRAAELLNRPDLIRERRANNKGCSLAAYAAAKRLPAEFLLSLGIREITYQGSRFASLISPM